MTLGAPRLPTPVVHSVLGKLLHGYKDASFVVQGFIVGFLLGLDGDLLELRSKNSLSASLNVDIVLNKVNEEIKLGRIQGPFTEPPFVNFICSPLALREKSTKGKYRLLHNLSFPYDERSVNFNIPDSKSKVTYSTLSDAFKIINEMGTCFLAKSDIADAFRIVPLHPSQYPLTGFKVNELYYYDRCLPMGARSACQTFERFSDAILFMLKSRYNVSNVVKVLDDFLFLGVSSEGCRFCLECFESLCNRTGIPIASHKTEGPTKSLSFLGIEIDTGSSTARVPDDKLKKYRDAVNNLLKCENCTLRDLKSIIGQLQFACTVIPEGRCFLRRLHDLTMGKSNPNSVITFPAWAKEDLLMWRTFLDRFNGITIYNALWKGSSKDLSFFSDSCPQGFGGTFKRHFIQGSFPREWKRENIAVLELFPIYALVHIFAPSLVNGRIIFHCDNESIVHILNNKTSKDPAIMSLLRPLVLTLMNNNIVLKVYMYQE